MSDPILVVNFIGVSLHFTRLVRLQFQSSATHIRSCEEHRGPPDEACFPLPVDTVITHLG